MAVQELKGKKVAILVADGFEQVEMAAPREALERSGAATELVSPANGEVQAFRHDQPGDSFPVDVPLSHANPEEYDALLLPGGVANPDALRINPEAIAFVRAFFEAGKPIAAICHGPWTLIEAGAVEGRTMTSWPSLRTDLRNAGANWVDREVVVDRGLVTSRKPDDIPAFNRKMIEEIREGNHGPNLSEPAHGGHQPGAF
jgi:protease I